MAHLPFGNVHAPWSETEGERGTAFRAFMANKFGPGTPSFLQRSVEDRFDPTQISYMFQRGLGNIPAEYSYPQALNRAPTSWGQQGIWPGGSHSNTAPWFLKNQINQASNLFNPGGSSGNLQEAFRQYLADNQGEQFKLAMAHGTAGMPAFLTPSLRTHAQSFFDKWLTSLPQGEAAQGVPASQLNFLPHYLRSGFQF